MDELPRYSRFFAARVRMAKRHVQRRLQRNDFTIISDDCWGGRLYSEFGLRCYSPFVGMGFTAHEYLDFLCGFREAGALDILGEKLSEEGYPLLKTRYAWLFGQHYDSAAEFRHAFERRCKTIRWDRVFIKIDFGKFKYRPEDIARWNELRLPNSVALYPNRSKFRDAHIHNGVALLDWTVDGAKQFGVSCRSFDILDWLNHGRVGWSAAYGCRQFLWMERDVVGRTRGVLRRGFKKVFPRKRKAAAWV